MLRLMGKSRQFQSYLLVAAVLSLFAGMLQGNESPQIVWIRYAVMLFRVLFGLISPFAFLFFGLALVFNGVLLINKEGWAKRYALLLAVGIFILLMDLLFLLNYFVFHHYLPVQYQFCPPRCQSRNQDGGCVSRCTGHLSRFELAP